jgi:O-antigen ligase
VAKKRRAAQGPPARRAAEGDARPGRSPAASGRANRRAATPADLGGGVAAACLAAVLAATALAVDTTAAASFDAPKRLAAVLGVALAAAAAFAWPPPGDGRERSRAILGRGVQRAAAILAGAALVLAVVSALASPRRDAALDAARIAVLLSLLLPLGASRAVARHRGLLAVAFLGASALNALVAVLQSRGLYQPFQLETFGQRQDTGAYAGNVGYLAIALAIASVLALGIALEHPSRRVRISAAALLPLYAAALVVNQNLTALTALLAGAAVLLVLRFQRRALLPMAAAVLLVGGAVAAYPPLRVRAAELGRAASARDWDTVLSFRGGPWAAAIEMARERPLLGFGPGTFGAEYVPHRLSAEIRAHRRFLTPLLTSSYAEAHSDYLQLFSDVGSPAALCAIAAAAALLFAIARRAAGGRPVRPDATPGGDNPGALTAAPGGDRRSAEAVVLAALLATGAAAALTWFPLQRPVTAAPLLLAAGRAWRVGGERDGGSADTSEDGE